MDEQPGRVTDGSGTLEEKSASSEGTVAELRARNYQLEIDCQLSREFLGVVAHELRTPLNTIMGWASLLANRQVSGREFQQAFESINRNAKQQSRLIDQLLDVSSVAMGNLRLNFAVIDLSTLLESVIDSVGTVARPKRVRIERRVDRFAGPVMGDLVRLEQIVWKVVASAVIRSPSPGMVSIDLGQAENEARLTVSASEVETPDHSQSCSSILSLDTDDTGGFHLGLGFGLIQHLLELHGGSLVVSGDRARKDVRISLPIQRDPHASIPNAVHPAVAGMDVALQGTRVLVIDDDPDARELVTTIIAHSGGQVQAVGSAEEAMDAIPTFKPEVLVCDLAMPGSNGLDFLRVIREKEDKLGLQRLPALALTAYAGAEDRRRVMLAGYQVHLPKPADPLELLTAIVNLVATASPGIRSRPR